MNNKICIIPARSGSKRIKNKNLKEIAGKPLISWTIECALNSDIFDEIILSTDCEKILSIGKEYGLPQREIRPGNLSDDNATAVDVISHYLEGNKYKNSKVCYLQPTSPLRSAGDVKDSFELMEREQAYSVISVNEYETPENWIYNPDYGFDYFVQSLSAKRSQDYPKKYVLNGAIYWFLSEKFCEYKTHLIPKKVFPYFMPKERSVDIDNQIDLDFANFLLKKSLLKSK